MTSLPSRHPPVQPGPPVPRPPFRPVKSCDEISWADFDNRLEFTIARGKVRETYHVTPLSTDLAGVALRVQKVGGGGEGYDLLLGGENTTCSCPGWGWTEGCKHLAAVQMLVEAGVLRPAPGSAAGNSLSLRDCDESDLSGPYGPDDAA